MAGRDPKALVQQILSGEISLEDEPWLVDDDILHFSVDALASQDPGWLLARLVDTRLDFEVRLSVTGHLNKPPRAAALRFLHRENSNHPVWKLLVSQMQPANASDARVAAGVEGIDHKDASERDRHAEELRDFLNSDIDTESAASATEALLDLVLHENDKVVLESALNALADAASRSDLTAAVDWTPVAAGLECIEDEQCLLHALEALETLGDSRFQPAVARLKDHPSAAIRLQVSAGLAQSGGCM